MTIILKKNATKKDIEAAQKKIGIKKRGKSQKGTFHEFFGTLKRGYDGLEYQKKVRSEWD